VPAKVDLENLNSNREQLTGRLNDISEIHHQAPEQRPTRSTKNIFKAKRKPRESATPYETLRETTTWKSILYEGYSPANSMGIGDFPE